MVGPFHRSRQYELEPKYSIKKTSCVPTLDFRWWAAGNSPGCIGRTFQKLHLNGCRKLPLY